MASRTLTQVKFPPTTVVSVYLEPTPNFLLSNPSGAPSGSAITSATVASDGTLTFTGLPEGKSLIAYAGTPDRYEQFDTLGSANVQTAAQSLQAGVIGYGSGKGRKMNPTSVPASLTSGTDTAPVSGTKFIGEIDIPVNTTLTGVQFLIGTVGGTDKVIVSLYDEDGNLLANSALAGTNVGAGAAVYQQVPFTAPFAAKGPGVYYIVIEFNGTTCRFRSLAAGGVRPCGSVAGVFATLPSPLAIPTTFTADKAPIASTY